MANFTKIVSALLIVVGIVLGGYTQSASAADSKDLDYEILKYNTEDVSIANDYFNKPAKLIDKDGKQHIQITVNHSHWITDMSIEGNQGQIINEDKGKDERTIEFPISKTSGKVDGKISVYIDEEVNGKPFKYDHHYNITYLLKGAANGSDSKDETAGITKSENGGTGSDTTDSTKDSLMSDNSDKTSTSTTSVENPQTNAGTPIYMYLIPVVALVLLVLSISIMRRVKRGNN